VLFRSAIELYAELFEQAGQLARLEGFASRQGAAFYGLPPNRGRLRLEKRPWTAPTAFPFGADRLVPLRAGQTIPWRLADAELP
jgi:dihydroorotase